MAIFSSEPQPAGAVRTRAGVAPGLVATSAVSIQCGAALATKLFDQVGPEGAVSLRLAFATAALLLVVRPRPADLRRLLSAGRRRDLAVMVAFGLSLGAMNLSFYEAIARIPLGVAVTVEFTGPLAVSLAGSRRLAHVLWATLAGGGVVLLAAGGMAGAVRHLDIAGVGFALLAGCFWAAYILVNKETGKRFPGASGLVGALAVAAVIAVPLGISTQGARLLRPEVLGIGLAVAVLSSALPYSCDLAALRRATPRAFGVLVSMNPGIAALAGLAILGQRLSLLEVGALVLVVAANVGNAWTGSDARGRPGDGDAAPVAQPTLAD